MKAKVIALTIGGIIAAAVALLYAPNSGAQTRQMIGERSHQAIDRTRQFLQDTQQSADQFVKRNTRHVIDEASAIIDQGKDQMSNTRHMLTENDTAA